MKIQRSLHRQHRRLTSQKTGEEYSFSSILSESLGAKEIFVSHEIIPSGSRSSAPHLHKATEEIIYLLKGSLMAFEGNEETDLVEGDVICFESDSKDKHYLENKSQDDAHVLVIRRRLNESDVVF